MVLVLMGEPLRDSGRVTFFGRGETPLNWISAGDVADQVVQALGNRAAPNRTLVLGGPQTFTRLQVLATLEGALGRRARRRHVPLAVIRVIKGAAGPFHPGMRHLLELVLAEETRPESIPVDPDGFHWIAPTRLETVVARWARGASDGEA